MVDEESRLIERLVKEIDNLKLGLDPTVLAGWYSRVEAEAKSRAPEHLKDTIQVVQNEILPMKFEFKTSRRAVGYVLDAIDRNLEAMPLATRLYFQKLSELIQAEMNR
jgi:hypothetical protein